MPDLISSLQDYQRKAAAHSKRVYPCPPFSLYLHPTDSFPFFNYAIPDHPIEELSREELDALEAAFVAHERTLRFEFLHEHTPRLRHILDALGVPQESENPLLICRPDTWTAVPQPAGLEIRRLTSDSPDTDIAANIEVGSRGFGDEERGATPERIADLRRRLGLGNEYFLALLDGQPAGVGAYMVLLNGMTEAVGIATLPEFRRRGIAAAITAELTQYAFKQGAHTAFLTAADDDASRVYQRSGYRRVGTGLAYGGE